MNRKTSDFWQDHSIKYLAMALNTDRMEPMADPDGIGTHHGDCGDTVEMSLKLRDDTIVQVALQVRGCLNTVASANAVAELVAGRPVRDAWELTPAKVIAYLETLPEAHHHCAEYAVGALSRALADLRIKQQQPWRKMYCRGGLPFRPR